MCVCVCVFQLCANCLTVNLAKQLGPAILYEAFDQKIHRSASTDHLHFGFRIPPVKNTIWKQAFLEWVLLYIPPIDLQPASLSDHLGMMVMVI